MRTRDSEAGFTIVELMIASMITLMIMGVAFSTFQNALQLNDAVIQLADSNQNLRAGTNLLVRDLMQAGRNIPVGGIAIPSGAGADAIDRPSPPDQEYFFDNEVVGARLSSITTGVGKGLEVSGRPTDLITMVTADPYLDELELYQADAPDDFPRVVVNGASLSFGDSEWLLGDPENGVPAIKVGDLLFFAATGAGNAIQTVTSVDLDAGTVFFELDDDDDEFHFNQRADEKCVYDNADGTEGVELTGSIINGDDCLPGSFTEILPDIVATPYQPDDLLTPDVDEGSKAVMSVRRVLMYTYYVAEEDEAPGVPRLMRKMNHTDAIALAGVIEDLTLRYDLVGGDDTLVDIAELPYPATEVLTAGQTQYTPNTIRKVNVHVGVRSETRSTRSGDYLRQHMSTVVSIRNLAWVSRYNTEEEENDD